MDKHDKEPPQGKWALASALAQIDTVFRGDLPLPVQNRGEWIDVAREICARCELDEELCLRLRDLAKRWLRQGKSAALAGELIAIARRNGDNRPYVALLMDLRAEPPDASLLPLQAWTTLYMWSTEAGPGNNVKLPDWVWDYLNQTAYEIQRLRANFRMEPTDKLADVLRALGFAGGGRNIFVADEKSNAPTVAALVYESAGLSGLTGDVRIAEVIRMLGLRDARTARRRVKEGRKYLSKSMPPWAK